MDVKVTQKHIDESRKIFKKNPRATRACYCPIALALKELTGEGDVTVGLGSAFIKNKHYTLPEKAVDFIQKFDEKTPIEPIKFTL